MSAIAPAERPRALTESAKHSEHDELGFQPEGTKTLPVQQQQNIRDVPIENKKKGICLQDLGLRKSLPAQDPALGRGFATLKQTNSAEMGFKTSGASRPRALTSRHQGPCPGIIRNPKSSQPSPAAKPHASTIRVFNCPCYFSPMNTYPSSCGPESLWEFAGCQYKSLGC